MQGDVTFNRRPGLWRERMVYGAVVLAISVWFTPKFAVLAWRSFTQPGHGGNAAIGLGVITIIVAAMFATLGVLAVKGFLRAYAKRSDDWPLLSLSASGLTLWPSYRDAPLSVPWSSIRGVSVRRQRYGDVLVLDVPNGRARTGTKRWGRDTVPLALRDRTGTTSDIVEAIRSHPGYRGGMN